LEHDPVLSLFADVSIPAKILDLQRYLACKDTWPRPADPKGATLGLSAAQDRFPVHVSREKEKIVDVGFSTSATAIGQENILVLQLLHTKLLNGKCAAVPDEISPVGPLAKEFKQQPRRLLPMPVLRLNQEDGLTAFE
jgi:hypothetical protein